MLITAIDGLGHGERAAWAIVGAELFGVGLARPGGAADGRAAPLLPVDLMRIPLFALSVDHLDLRLHRAVDGAGLAAVPVREHAGASAQVRTGLLMTPWPLVVAVIAPFTGRLADRYPVGILSGCGLTVLAVGLGLARRCCRRIRHRSTSSGAW